MKNSLLYLILSVFVFFSCSKEKEQEIVPETVTITGTITNQTTEKVTISYRASSLDNEKVTLAEAELDSTGYFETTFELAKPVQALVANGEYTKVYLEPGDSLSLTVNAAEFDETVTWAGIGAERQNYLAKKMLLTEEFRKNTKGLYAYEQEVYEEAIGSIRKSYDSLYKVFFDSIEVNEDFATFEKAEILSNWGSYKMRYPTYHKRYADLDEFEVPDSYYVFMEKIPLDKKYLVSGAYTNYLGSIVRKEFSDYTTANPQDSSVNEIAGYMHKMSEIIASLEMSAPLKDYLTGSNLYDYISYSGVDSTTTSLLTAYKESNINPEYLAVVEKSYQKWSKLAEGSPAIDFTYTSLDSTDVALSDFVGKVVYIDVWATWCGPCMRELPSAKELHTYFGDREDLVLLYVTVDKDIEAWKKMLAEDDEFRNMGVHLASENAWDTKITKDYMIKGIPRYILIGKDGNIADATAPRPSSGDEIKEAIEALLTAGTVSKL